MKGVLFTEFLEMIEDQYSSELIETIISKANLSSGGVYTSLGYYNSEEFISLVDCFCNLKKKDKAIVLLDFGKHLFKRFLILYPELAIETKSTFEFIKKVKDQIHLEVQKIYPHAEVPSLNYEIINSVTMKLHYHSERPLADLAHGLLLGCILHTNERITVNPLHLSSDKTMTTFELLRNS